MSIKTLALIGATGLTGQYVVKEALARGYQLRILARTPEKIEPHARVTVIQGDAMHSDALNDLLTGADAVVSTLGPSGMNSSLKEAKVSAKAFVCSNSTRLLLPLMEQHGIHRVIFTGGLSLKTEYDQNNWLMRILLTQVAPRILGDMCEDRQIEYDLLKQSLIDWTIARCGGIKESAAEHTLKSSDVRVQGGKIHPRSLARFLLDQLDHNAHSRRAVYVASS